MFPYLKHRDFDIEENDFHIYDRVTYEWQDSDVERHVTNMSQPVELTEQEKDWRFSRNHVQHKHLNPDGSPSPFLQPQARFSVGAGYLRDPSQGNKLVKL